MLQEQQELRVQLAIQVLQEIQDLSAQQAQQAQQDPLVLLAQRVLLEASEPQVQREPLAQQVR